MTAVADLDLPRPHDRLLREACALPTSTYQGSRDLPFQRWYRFKEAFAPRFVVDAVESAGGRVRSIVDPFSGSGTTALTAQFMGIAPTAIEVNPFMADLARAKLEPHEPSAVRAALERILAMPPATIERVAEALAEAPRTLVEPGVKGRWVFDRDVAREIVGLVDNIRALDAPDDVRRLLRVLLAACVVPASNVVISGKGRRYRGGWDRRTRESTMLPAYRASVERAVEDLEAAGERPHPGFTLLEGDARELVHGIGEVDMALLSPPYPNSFDYVDIYNLELWMLGYLDSRAGNQVLRTATLRSHVQIKRPYPGPVGDSPLLGRTLAALEGQRPTLWNRHIPDMVAGYFGDMERVMAGLRANVRPGGSVIIVAGDSRYGTAHVPVVGVLSELARDMGFSVRDSRAVRVMRASPQQGGRHELEETLLHLVR